MCLPEPTLETPMCIVRGSITKQVRKELITCWGTAPEKRNGKFQ